MRPRREAPPNEEEEEAPAVFVLKLLVAYVLT